MTHNGTVHNGLTAEEMLARLLGVDGAGSLLDADTLDALSSASFARSGANTDITSLAGTATNDSAAAGKVGEIITSSVAPGAPVSLSTGTAKTVTSISLTAGDWDVDGLVGFVSNAATSITLIAGAVHTTTDAFPTSPGTGAYFSINLAIGGGATMAIPTGTMRISLAAPASAFLVASSNFMTNSNAGYGFIRGRRVR